MSHVFALDVPHYHKLLFYHRRCIEPTLDEKHDIVQKAIDLCTALDIAHAKGGGRGRRARRMCAIVLTSGADSTLARLASCALARKMIRPR
jgi:hypothetical protein